MYTANPPLICSEPTVLKMERVSDRSAVNLVADPISDAGGFFLPVPLLSFEQWTSTWTPDSPADNYRPPVNAEASSLISCGATPHCIY